MSNCFISFSSFFFSARIHSPSLSPSLCLHSSFRVRFVQFMPFGLYFAAWKWRKLSVTKLVGTSRHAHTHSQNQALILFSLRFKGERKTFQILAIQNVLELSVCFNESHFLPTVFPLFFLYSTCCFRSAFFSCLCATLYFRLMVFYTLNVA